MGRPRLDRPVMGAPVSTWPAARKDANGKVLYFYMRFRDEAGQEHTVRKIDTRSVNEARKQCRAWMSGIEAGVTIISGSRDALDKFLASRENEQTRRAYSERVGQFLRFHRWKDVRDLTFAHLSAYLDAGAKGLLPSRKGRKRKKWAGTTRRNNRIAIQTFATWLFNEDITEGDWGYDHKNRRYKEGRFKQPKVRWIWRQDYFLLRAAIRDPSASLPDDCDIGPGSYERIMALEPAIELASLGLRLNAIRVLRTYQIQRRARLVDVESTKDYGERKIRLTDDLDDIFKRTGIYKLGPHDFLMHDSFRNERCGYDQRLLNRVSLALGIHDNKGRPVSFHTLRRSCGVWLAQSGRNEPDIGRYLGHAANSPMPRRYMDAVADLELLDSVDRSRDLKLDFGLPEWKRRA